VFVGGARVIRKQEGGRDVVDDEKEEKEEEEEEEEEEGVDCVGGCNTLFTSCGLTHHRASCFVHDICSIAHQSVGFVFDPKCGDEALDAMITPWMCGGQEKW